MIQSSIAPQLKQISEARGWAGEHPEHEIWQRVAHSIDAIGTQLFEWGREINDQIEPDEQTMLDAGEGLSELESELIKLHFWLGSRFSQRWATLRRELLFAREKWWGHEIKSAFFDYVEQKKNDQLFQIDNAARKWRHEQRSIAGTNMMSFGLELKQAVTNAQLQPLVELDDQ